MKILALTKYSYEGPSSRYRFYNYQKCFQKNGIEMTIEPLFSKTYLQDPDKFQKIMIVLWAYLKRFAKVLNLLIFNKYNLLLIEYELFPYFPPLFEYLLKKRGIKYLVDYDDAIFHKYDMSSNPIIKLFLKRKIASVIKNATYCIACNEYLMSYIKKYNQNILKLPTVVLLDKYQGEMKSFTKENPEKFIIGWIGSRTTSIYIIDLLPVFKQLIAQHPDIQINLIGFDQNILDEKTIIEHHLNIIPWTEEKEIKNILDMDIGIMPLTNDSWSRGKCGFKLIQYMSCKKPVVASPVGINCSLVENGINGFLVESRDEWYNVFEKLYLDKMLRERMAKNNFYKIETEYNNMINCEKYSQLIKRAIDIKKETKC